MSVFVRTGTVTRKQKRSINKTSDPVHQRPTVAIALPVPARKTSSDSKAKSTDKDGITIPRTRKYGIAYYVEESAQRKMSTQSRSSHPSVKLSLDLMSIGKPPINPVSPTESTADRTSSFKKIDYIKSISLDDPSYETLLIQIKETTGEANTLCDFLYKATAILCGSVSATGLLFALITVHFAMVIVGVKYLAECPKQPKIPVYLLVGGCFGMLLIVVIMWRQVEYRRADNLDVFDDSMDTDTSINRQSSTVTDAMLVLFHITWLIFGTVWVFGIWKPNFDQLISDPNNWCDGNVYMFAVCQILGYYCLTGLALIMTLFLCVCYCCRNISDPSFT